MSWEHNYDTKANLNWSEKSKISVITIVLVFVQQMILTSWEKPWKDNNQKGKNLAEEKSVHERKTDQEQNKHFKN